MRPSTSLIVTLSFLLWFFFTTTKPSLASDHAEPVFDIDGDPLSPRQEYYIVSAIWGAGGGGVRPERTGDSSCSYSIIQERSDLRRGDPVKFLIQEESSRMIYPGSTNLEIEFLDKPECAQSSKWKVAYESGSSSSSPMLVIGGPKDHPQAQLASGFFQIEEFNSFSYELVFCPGSNFNGSDRCYNIGIEHQDEHRYLVVQDGNERPFMVVFMKADSGKGKSNI